MKEGEDRARTEVSKRAQMEEEVAQLKEKMWKLKAECIHSIGKAREDKKEEIMGKVKAQFQTVYNSAFRDGWKSALNKIEVLETSELFLQANTLLLYPIAGFKDMDDEADEEEEDGEA